VSCVARLRFGPDRVASKRGAALGWGSSRSMDGGRDRGARTLGHLGWRLRGVAKYFLPRCWTADVELGHDFLAISPTHNTTFRGDFDIATHHRRHGIQPD
jgi:hypothetical protein